MMQTPLPLFNILLHVYAAAMPCQRTARMGCRKFQLFNTSAGGAAASLKIWPMRYLSMRLCEYAIGLWLDMHTWRLEMRCCHCRAHFHANDKNKKRIMYCTQLYITWDNYNWSEGRHQKRFIISISNLSKWQTVFYPSRWWCMVWCEKW